MTLCRFPPAVRGDPRISEPGLLREMIRGFAQQMMDAEVESCAGRGYGEVRPGPGELP